MAGAQTSVRDKDRMPDRGVARRQAFLSAAREVFLEQGFEAASVNDVVRRAGGSLATLYSQFGNKEGLFLAVATDQSERFHREILPQSVDHLGLEDGLVAIGEHYVKAILTRDNLAFYRIIVGEGRKFPDEVKSHIATGADQLRDQVAHFLNLRTQKEGLRFNDPDAAASFFTGLLRARHHYLALANPDYALTDDALGAHVRSAVALFLRGALAR